MSLSEELGRLGALHERGVLSDEEFARAKTRVLGGAPEVTAPALLAINALRRSREDRWLGGVCGGIARVTGVESWIWRLLFALLALCAGAVVSTLAFPVSATVASSSLPPPQAVRSEPARRAAAAVRAKRRKPVIRTSSFNVMRIPTSGFLGLRQPVTDTLKHVSPRRSAAEYVGSM